MPRVHNRYNLFDLDLNLVHKHKTVVEISEILQTNRDYIYTLIKKKTPAFNKYFLSTKDELKEEDVSYKGLDKVVEVSPIDRIVSIKENNVYLNDNLVGKILKSNNYGLLILVEKSKLYPGGLKRFYGIDKDTLIREYKSKSKIYKSIKTNV